MCGIVGGYRWKDCESAPSVLNHRGPDSTGVFVDGEVFLGHTRLSIQDLSHAGHQPLVSSCGSAVITYNGEIYNTKDLRDELTKRRVTFRGHSDTEIVLALYLEYGRAMLQRLNGIFSFAIWDKRTRELFVARDGLGVKPFYFAENKGRFRFSSEIKGILNDPTIDRSVNVKAVLEHLVYLWCPAPHTVIEGVEKLEPGHAMIIRNGSIVDKWQFYDLPYATDTYEADSKSAIEKTRDLIFQAVQKQLIADVPVGTFLSGGLDSSAVTAFAKQCRPNTRMHAFSIDLKGKWEKSEGTTDDLPFARQVAKYLDVDLHVVTVGSEILSDLEKMIYHLDEPQADPAALNILRISKHAREHGIKVLLSGAGGDDIFSGYRRHLALVQERYWSWLPKSLRSILAIGARGLPVGHHSIRRLSKAFQYANLDGNTRLASYFYWLNPDLIHGVLSSGLQNTLSDYDVSQPLQETLERLPKQFDPLHRMLYLDAKHFLVDHNLNYTDKMGMAEGVEIRVPLLDVDLVKYATSLPINYKQRGSTGKWIFREAMDGILPPAVLSRPKTGFGGPLRHWMRNELSELVNDTLSASNLRHRGFFDPIGVEKLRKLDAEGKVDAAYTIFAILCMEMWSHIFLDKKIPMYERLQL